MTGTGLPGVSILCRLLSSRRQCRVHSHLGLPVPAHVGRRTAAVLDGKARVHKVVETPVWPHGGVCGPQKDVATAVAASEGGVGRQELDVRDLALVTSKVSNLLGARSRTKEVPEDNNGIDRDGGELQRANVVVVSSSVVSCLIGLVCLTCPKKLLIVMCLTSQLALSRLMSSSISNELARKPVEPRLKPLLPMLSRLLVLRALVLLPFFVQMPLPLRVALA